MLAQGRALSRALCSPRAKEPSCDEAAGKARLTLHLEVIGLGHVEQVVAVSDLERV